mmetsp:Transcript_60603/g.174852  ORF Transcript_60603/g.174852 Transcript_60603/m.174852 type:complete len:86 (-) Transcript_60603:705-962(-)
MTHCRSEFFLKLFSRKLCFQALFPVLSSAPFERIQFIHNHYLWHPRQLPCSIVDKLSIQHFKVSNGIVGGGIYQMQYHMASFYVS